MERLKELRKARHMSQEALARALHVGRTTVTMWEKGVVPNGAILQELADYFGTSVDYLMGRDAPETAAADDEEEEFWQLRERLRRDPDLRMLFSLTQNATSADIRKTVAILKTIQENS